MGVAAHPLPPRTVASGESQGQSQLPLPPPPGQRWVVTSGVSPEACQRQASRSSNHTWVRIPPTPRGERQVHFRQLQGPGAWQTGRGWRGAAVPRRGSSRGAGMMSLVSAPGSRPLGRAAPPAGPRRVSAKPRAGEGTGRLQPRASAIFHAFQCPPSFRPRGSQSLCFSRAVPARRWMLSSPLLFILAVLVSLFAPRPRFRFRLRPASPLCLLSCSATFAPSLSLGTHLFSPLACPVPPIFRCPSSYFPGRNVITSPPGPPPLSSLPLPSSRVLLLACPCHTLGRGAGGEDLEKVQSNLGSEHSNPSPARL